MTTGIISKSSFIIVVVIISRSINQYMFESEVFKIFQVQKCEGSFKHTCLKFKGIR